MFDMIQSFQAGEVILLRSESISWQLGRAVKGPVENFPIIASVQNLKPNERLLLPEGRRTREAVKVYTEMKLRTTDEANSLPADILVWRGKQYEIMSVEDWTQTDLPHYLAIATKLDGEGGGNEP